jgi:hypothetical protein
MYYYSFYALLVCIFLSLMNAWALIFLLLFLVSPAHLLIGRQFKDEMQRLEIIA